MICKIINYTAYVFIWDLNITKVFQKKATPRSISDINGNRVLSNYHLKDKSKDMCSESVSYPIL